MAGGMDLGGGKGKKSLDVAINLTPFIDLMAVTISFLIMTAVWTQIGRLQVAQAGGPSTDEEQKQEEQTKTVQLTLFVTPTELKLVADQSEFPSIEAKRGANGKLDLAPLLALQGAQVAVPGPVCHHAADRGQGPLRRPGADHRPVYRRRPAPGLGVRHHGLGRHPHHGHQGSR